jgi:hypothetical protein
MGREWETRLDFLASTHEPLSLSTRGPGAAEAGGGSWPGAATRMRYSAHRIVHSEQD